MYNRRGKFVTFVKLLLTALCTGALFWAVGANEWPSALALKKPFSGDNHALIIGIGNYDQWPKLISPEKDAQEIARILTKRYNFKKENIVLLTDKSSARPTRKTILSYLENYVAKLTENDHLLIFFAGHSTEDDNGETYWIPIDGGKRSKLSWLKHSDLSQKFFASQNLKCKSLYIISDSLFSKKLFKRSFIRISPRDLRYTDKLKELALLQSRKLIALGEEHWEPMDWTDGFGLFTYYFRQALLEDWPEIVDFENMIFFDEKRIVLPVLKRTGVRMLRGRLRRSPDRGGESFIALAARSPAVDIAEIKVSPQSVQAGDSVLVEVKTAGLADEVYVEFEGKRHLMGGEGAEWKRAIQVSKAGTHSLTVTAYNRGGDPGKKKTGYVAAVAKGVNVIHAMVSPSKGFPGDRFQFKATTDSPAKSVTLIMGGKRYMMLGSGTKWELSTELNEKGSIEFSVSAGNKDGLEGAANGGVVLVESRPVKVMAVQINPESVYLGDDFVIRAQTDRPARAVALEIDGLSYSMHGFGKQWEYRPAISQLGRKEFAVVAKNFEDRPGPERIGEVIIQRRPLPLAAVTQVTVSPKETYAGEQFVIKVRTSDPAEKVFLKLANTRYLMGGAGSEWVYLATVKRLGPSRYSLAAINADGKQGPVKEGRLTILKRPAEKVNVSRLEVDPGKGYVGEQFRFTATTDLPAEHVMMVIGDQRYTMQGSGTNWQMTTTLADIGVIDFSTSAINKDGVEGAFRSGILLVEAHPVKVVGVQAAPAAIYSGEEFVIEARTDRPAQSVALQMDGLTYAMQGSGKQWHLRRTIAEIGKKRFSLAAKNIEEKPGPQQPGEVVIQRRPLPLAQVADVSVSPTELYAGKPFVIKTRTTAAADRVYVEIGGERHLMDGAGTEWIYLAMLDEVGTSRYKLVARNADGREGAAREGQLTIIKPPAGPVNVARLQVSPPRGYVAENFSFKVETDEPATRVDIVIGSTGYTMRGSGRRWFLDRQIEQRGMIDFSVTATNEDGKPGGSQSGLFMVAAHPVNVVEVLTAPEAIYSGESFVIRARTDRPAQGVAMQMDGLIYALEGAGKQWQLRRTIAEIGRKKYTLIAKNIENKPGLQQAGEITIQRRALPLAEVAKVSVSPKEIYAGEQFVIRVQTTVPADKVYVDIDGRRHSMDGAGTKWSYLTTVDRIGTSRFKVLAVNSDGKSGKRRDERIAIAERPAEVVSVAKLSVNPGKGYVADLFLFKAETDRLAKRVNLVISGTTYEMKGSGQKWYLERQIEERGTIAFSVSATNEDERPGGSKIGFFTVEAHPVKVVGVQAAPAAIYSGEEFVIEARTDRPAQSVALQMDGLTYAMQGSGKQWHLRRTIAEIGKKRFSLAAKNIEEKPGPQQPGEVVIQRRPLPLAQVADVSVSPTELYAGKPFVIKTRTTAAADRVYVEIGGERHLMDGAGTEWIYLAMLDEVGTSRYKLVARNADGREGAAREGQLTIIKPPAGPVNVARLQVSPPRGYVAENFSFKVETDEPATRVDIVIGSTGYTMRGSGRRWFLDRQIEQRGMIDFSVTATNEDGKPGGSQSGLFMVAAHPVNVVEVLTAPEAIYSGESFVIRARTDRPAQGVAMQMDGLIYALEGAGKQWQLRRTIAEIGRKKYTLIAKNIENKPGLQQAGEITIQRRALPLVNVAEISVKSKTVYAGEQFVIKARTNAAADRVSVEIEGEHFWMEGAGTEWIYLATLDRIGISRYAVTAINADGNAGPIKEDRITLVKRPAVAVSVAELEVNPTKGYAGQTFTFKAATDRSAEQVELVLAGKRYKMKGEDRQWLLALSVGEVGSQEIEIIATNKDGMEGRPEKGILVVEAHPVKVADLQVTPRTLYTGDDLLIQVVTDRPAKSVSLQMGGLTYDMIGSDKQWQLEKRERVAGQKKFTVIARNIENKPGPPKPGTITVKQLATRVPAVTAVSVSSALVFVGQQFAIEAQTNIPADSVRLAIDGKMHIMGGSGTSWHYTTSVDKPGEVNFRVSARNKEGRESKPKASSVTIARKIAETIRVAKLELNPSKGYTGRQFTFKAETDEPANSVFLIVGGNRYEMKGSGKNWRLTQKILKPGELQVNAIAINEAGDEGAVKTALLNVLERVIAEYKCNKDGTVTNNQTGQTRSRFADNGDGTITDLCTDLMWLKQPKRVAVNWREAREFCKELNTKKYKGWRLPTLKEMNKLIDKRQKDPALPLRHPFSEVHTYKPYWTKTDSRPPLYVYQMDLSRGRRQSASKRRNANVWPVRYTQ